ncbi:MAG: hypothetical protein QME52_09960 [Bacteroidota bacterium]|nr:hypothetical protein [Bacteroidota bacterium]
MKIILMPVMVLIIFNGSLQLKSHPDSIGTSLKSDSLGSFFRFEDSPSFGFLATYFPSFFIQNGLDLKTFIRSRTFRIIREQYGDLRSVDAIYIQALKLTYDNTAIALLLSLVACFDHRFVGLKVPVFALFFPLSNESEEEFRQRVSNLPRFLYSDTPAGKIGDRDKLQHFFGSAFLAFIFESQQVADNFSDFIEQGEKTIIVDGVLDERDIRANRDGQRFGLALLDNNHLLPSAFLKHKTNSIDSTGVK